MTAAQQPTSQNSSQVLEPYRVQEMSRTLGSSDHEKAAKLVEVAIWCLMVQEWHSHHSAMQRQDHLPESDMVHRCPTSLSQNHTTWGQAYSRRIKLSQSNKWVINKLAKMILLSVSRIIFTLKLTSVPKTSMVSSLHRLEAFSGSRLMITLFPLHRTDNGAAYCLQWDIFVKFGELLGQPRYPRGESPTCDNNHKRPCNPFP